MVLKECVSFITQLLQCMYVSFQFTFMHTIYFIFHYSQQCRYTQVHFIFMFAYGRWRRWKQSCQWFCYFYVAILWRVKDIMSFLFHKTSLYINFYEMWKWILQDRCQYVNREPVVEIGGVLAYIHKFFIK